MKVLVDTNVLLRLFQSSHPNSAVAATAISNLLKSGNSLYLVPQNLYELWVVATRPVGQNGFGMTSQQTEELVGKCGEQFRLLRDERGIFDQWNKLVSSHSVQGKNAHDARLVAAMLRHSLTHLLTFNCKDFQRFNTISLLDPLTTVAG